MRLPPIPNGGGTLNVLTAEGVLGGKIWPAASALCQYLAATLSSPREKAACRNCVELGSGTGAVGLYAAALGLPVTLTEHRPPLASVMTSVPYSVDGTLEVGEFVGNARSNRLLTLLQNNVDGNLELFQHTPKVRELDWNNIDHVKQLSSSPFGVDLIVASDVAYSIQLHNPLATTISCLLASSAACPSKCLVSHEERLVRLGGEDLHLASFQQALAKQGLEIVTSYPYPLVDEGGTHHKVSILEIQCKEQPAFQQ